MKKHFLLIIFLVFYLTLSLITHKNYGITWDEQAVYERGKMLYRHLIDPNHKSVNDLLNRDSVDDVWPTYYSGYSMILFSLNQNQSYDLYHLYNLIFGSVIFIAAYFFIYLKYKNSFYAILGPLFILLNPRFSGDIAGNPKDMSFAVMYFISVTAIYLTSKYVNVLPRILILGFLFSFTQGLRTIGFGVYLIFIIFELYINREKLIIKKGFNFVEFKKFLVKIIPTILLIFIVANFFMAISWPYIGGNYFKHLTDVFRTASLFPWSGNVFFLGKYFHSLDLPLTYLPVLLLVSLPVFIIISSLGSLFLIKKHIAKNEVFFLVFTVLVINFIFYFTVNPVVYNGLRHFLFILPFFSLLSVIFIIEVIKNSHPLKKFFIIFITINCLFVIISITKIFPYQYLYFNELVGGFKGGAKNFEIDYWNASFKEGIEWLKKHELDPDIKYGIYTCSSSHSLLNYFTYNLTWAKDLDEADYAICHTSSQEYKNISGDILYTVERDSVPLNYVIKINR